MSGRAKVILLVGAALLVAAMVFLLVLLTTITEVTWCDDVGVGGRSECHSEWRWGWW